MSAGHFLRNMFEKAETDAKTRQDKFEKERSADIDMYRKVLLDPNSSDEQRTKAATEIEKLRNIKGKDGPFSGLAGILNKISGHVKEQKGKMQPPPQAGESPVQTMPNPNGGTGQQPQVPAQPAEGQPKRNVAEKALGKVEKGLGAVVGVLGSHPRELPALDTSVFPTADQTAKGEFERSQKYRVNAMKQYRDDLKEANPRMSDEQLDKAVEQKFGATPKPKYETKIVEDPNSPTGRSYVTRDAISGEEVSRQLNAPKPPSEEPRDTDTNTTDPYGGTTTTHTHRQLSKDKKTGNGSTGGSGSKGGMTPPPGSQTKPSGQPGAGAAASGEGSKPPSGPSGSPKLDPEGHIPPSPEVNERVREIANQLLDGTDKEKVPEKGREQAAALARKYGWEQGKFTPKEQVMLKEAGTFLKEASTSPAWAVLDGGFAKRFKLSQVFQNPDKEGFIGRGASLMAAQSLSPQEQEFVRMYNQLVGTISGMSQLVRSGRATEATIERLKNELPNPVTTTNSQDAKARIKRLLKELNVAMEKGSFEAPDSGSQGTQWGANPYRKTGTK